MAEDTLNATDLKAQYTAQVGADLERNAKEQERIGAEIAGLQEQLEALRRDQAVLMSVQTALGGPGAAAAAETTTGGPAAAVPQQRPASPRKQPRKKGSAKGKKPTDTAAPKSAKAPTLGELILGHLRQHTEPRSASEVTDTLAQAHPERETKAKVVRMTLESLVAKGLAERAKQGRSVFYSAVAPVPTTSSTPSADLATEDSAEQTES